MYIWHYRIVLCCMHYHLASDRKCDNIFQYIICKLCFKLLSFTKLSFNLIVLKPNFMAIGPGLMKNQVLIKLTNEILPYVSLKGDNLL